MNTNTKIFAFVLGREKELAYAELISVLEHFCFIRKNAGDVFRISGNIAFAKIDFSENRTDDFKKAISSLAGTIKIFLIFDYEKGVSGIVSLIKQLKNNSTKFNFGLSDYSEKNSVSQLNRLGIDIKINLKKNGFKTRFVASKDAGDLSSILTLKNDLVERGIEIGIFGENIDYRIGELIYLNNPEEWNERDYGKPKGDKFSGMLPPKLARMLVNLTLGQVNNKEVTIIDPFCGSGNVLMEAMMLNCDVVGSDISKKAVTDTKINLDWIASKQASASKYAVYQADATQYDFNQLPIGDKSVAIVAEPYLGRPKKYKPTLHEAGSEYNEIKKIYIGFLKNIKNSDLKEKKLAITLVFPLVETSDNSRFSLYEECVDEIKKMGYTQSRNSFIYGREYQTVKRQIVFLKFTKAE
jgi:tRNA G10  N-methylase Trm11